MVSQDPGNCLNKAFLPFANTFHSESLEDASAVLSLRLGRGAFPGTENNFITCLSHLGAYLLFSIITLKVTELDGNRNVSIYLTELWIMPKYLSHF